jgi:hypothetical protein
MQMNQPFIPPAAPAAYGQVPPFMQQPVAQPQGMPAGYAPQGYAQQPAAQPQPFPVAQPQAAAPGQLAQLLSTMRAAVDPTSYGTGFDHPQGSPWSPGQPGANDGEYPVCELVAVNFDPTAKGMVFRITCRVLESGNPRIAPGSEREIACFMWHAPSASEAKGHTQNLFEITGGQGGYTDEFAAAMFDPRQPLRGLRFGLMVDTKGKKSKPNEPVTKKRIRPCEVAAAPAPAPVAPAPVAPAQPQPQGWPSGVAQPPGMPAGMPAPFVPGAP